MIKVDLELERKEILKRYRKLLRMAKPVLKPGDAKIIKKAFNVSSEAHKEMRRKSGEPYIYHPLEVALVCVEEIGLGTTSIVAALLHDVVEDTEWELEDIQREFGPKVTQIIDGLTKISGVFEYGSSQQAENFRKMLLTLSDDVRVILIKLADRLNNMRTLESMPRHKQLKIASETMYLYAPLAHRLGLYAIKSELEDLYLKYTDTETYDFISQKISETRLSRNRFIKNFIAPIEKELTSLNFNYNIKGRPKSIYSIYNKMKKQNIPFEEVYDLFAIRIIIDTPYENEKADCWQVYSIVTDFYRPNPDRLRDWISTPRANGYESLHTTVMSNTGQWVEVQIRTQRMDDIAERGYAAHWKYKEKDSPGKASRGLDEWITQVRALMETNDGSAIEFMDDFRSNLFHDEVFVFTPKGDLKVLPFGATALDFAFDIHTEVGAKCIGAKVNQKLVSISHPLKNGDQVEILTSNKQKPNEDWLKSVVTSRAKAKIKDALREDKKSVILDGKEIVQRKLKQMKMDFSSVAVEQLRAFFETKTPNEFYYKVGKGIIDPTSIKSFKEFKDNKKEKSKSESAHKIVDEPSFVKEIKNLKGPSHDQLLIGEDMDVVDYILAKCCNPIPGDDVFGFVTVNEGIKIHRTSCPNALELLSNHGNRVIKARWTSQQEIAFLAGLKIVGTDRVGLINDVTKVISNELKVNMRSITVDSDSGIFEGSIKLYVHSTQHLDNLIRNLMKVNGVIKVTRFD
ncbi:bifunctional (p)ppGpp synthetase/guanosine-3',5'-bis(diphosphate) 3'-pyrophosphohydrolase [Litoribacter ruber]|uniref:Bifunctional (P)ppGpp synthetase/guanosine-3',5'-bis(Diphosphate) 3'-pyrophosphohydrolase n=1 Tax=Litoribacter ruber TaxID=702568 RepID=A0AAP2G6D5_9BACT|nr:MULTISPECIES: bifunctional (p)ppGpp synthetase/guanosine-3',5'-bis(diphosphate) 3'-pyrophosphohydrolase [Litoribacter]MBS9525951.1 bifunctional (p)ppGpp synthetase/guanosine-3',5'-bis(diphosphate) 3'-pyrophosphohydrolase [Litoribacter alkaliphilus]MBT0813119.1 bifunctional (p)ppGpp synthetase/guanosine-3',5'-bis(diphosphate) 3'-pyrophosphohydrolase [Litoribacter ruber]